MAPKTIKCEYCGTEVAPYNTVHLSSDDKTSLICLKCYNIIASEAAGSNFEHLDFDPIILNDTDGHEHIFHFAVRLFGNILSIESFELHDNQPSGYKFRVIGDSEDDPFQLFQKLFERMRRALNRKHIYRDHTTKSWQITEDDTIRAQITVGTDSDEIKRSPIIIIDGKEISWDEFGKMLLSFEGFNFKMNILDNSEEIP